MQNFIYKLPNKELLFIVFAVIFTLSMIFTVYVVNIPDTQALNTCATGWRVSSTSTTINCSGECRYVSKTSGSDFFVPTKTSSEWGSFISNPPSNASLSTGGGCAPSPTFGLRWQCVCDDPVDPDPVWVCSANPPSDCSSVCRFGIALFPDIYCSSLCNNSGCSI